VSFRLEGADVCQPPVVHALAGRSEGEVAFGDHAVAEHVVSVERDRLEVLTAVKDDLGRHPVAVHVGQPSRHVVVARRLRIPTRRFSEICTEVVVVGLKAFVDSRCPRVELVEKA